MANSQKHSTGGVEDIVVYKGDLISELRKTQHILREIVRDRRCCVCWDVLQKTYVGQCGHGICMNCASPMLIASTEEARCPLCQEVITHFHLPGRGGPPKITHSYTACFLSLEQIDHIYEPLRLWAAENMSTETGELTTSPETVPRRLEHGDNSQDEETCEYTDDLSRRLEPAGKSQDDESTDETMEPFHWAALLLIVGTFILL
ncbi:tripartite motif-containing 31 [Colletotrichum asianum]